MYGRVNGPFTNKINNNNKYIGITLHNKDSPYKNYLFYTVEEFKK